jgi:DNA processing protein
MAELVIVVEAREKSGSLITADFALEQGKDIYAVPGRSNDTMSAGCNRLIAQGAGIITSVSDFISNLQDMAFTGLASQVAGQDENFFLEKEETLVYSCFDFYPKSIEAVLQETGMELLQLLSVIINLCDKGFLREYYKNQYVRIK